MILMKRWDVCLDELKNEYIIDKTEKDKHSQNLMRSLKLLSEEAKKREILTYYRRCKAIYDIAYYEWR